MLKRTWGSSPSEPMKIVLEALEISAVALTKLAKETTAEKMQSVEKSMSYKPTLEDWGADESE